MEAEAETMEITSEPTMELSGKMVKIETEDDQLFEIEKEFAEKSVTIKNLVLDLGDDNDVAIPLPNITGPIFGKILEWMQVVSEEKKEQTDGPDKGKEDYIIDSDFIKSYFDGIPQETLFSIILASNFLDLRSLLDRSCKQVANMIKGKSPEEIRKLFNIKNDFTPEEEEKIRKENEWAEPHSS